MLIKTSFGRVAARLGVGYTINGYNSKFALDDTSGFAPSL